MNDYVVDPPIIRRSQHNSTLGHGVISPSITGCEIAGFHPRAITTCDDNLIWLLGFALVCVGPITQNPCRSHFFSMLVGVSLW